jgi:hypothetical protein
MRAFAYLAKHVCAGGGHGSRAAGDSADNFTRYNPRKSS